MKLIVLSEPAYFNGEASLINQLFEAGLSVFHLRKPGSDRLTYASLIAEIDVRYHDKIALHGFHDLILNFPSIKRLHFPEWLRKQTFKDGIPGPGAALKNRTWSTSIHHLKDLDQLKGFDYTFYGPVFDSISKTGYAGIADADLILPERNNNLRIIALGGINAGNVSQVKHMGFDGLAALGAIWKKKEQALDNFKQLANTSKDYFN
jgi:thiamine-phosphate pyrophosphorylase